MHSATLHVLRLLLKTALLLALGFGLVLAALWWGQEKLLFHPQRLAADHRFQVGPDVTEAWVEVPGARLNALHLQRPQPVAVVFFLHGNAGSLDNWFVDLAFYRRHNVDLYMIDYRGFGKSSGSIDGQAQLQADVRAAWDSIAPRYAGVRKVFYGRSLGTALAAQLATEVPPDLLVLVSPYIGMTEVARLHYPWIPSALLPRLLRYPLRTDLALQQVQSPLLLVHGAQDSLIPPSHSQALQALVPGSRLLLVPGAGHGDIHQYPLYLDTLADAIRGGVSP